MSAQRKLQKFQPANDAPPRKKRRVAVTLAPARPDMTRRLAAGGVLLLSVGLMGLTLSLAQKESAAPVAKIAEAKPQDIRVSASSLLAGIKSDDATINLVAGKIGNLPVSNFSKSAEPEVTEEEKREEILFQANSLIQNGAWDAALKLYDTILTDNAADHEALTGRIYALGKMNADDDAIESSHLLINIYPDDVGAKANLAALLARNNRNDEAVAVLDQAVRQAPSQISYRLTLASLHDRLGHKAEALALYRQIIAAVERDDKIALRLEAIRERADYLELSGTESGNPSTISPVAAR